MRRVLSDLRFALRLFRRTPRFYAAILAVLIGGIGATTAMVSISQVLLLNPLPFPQPGQLTTLRAMQTDGGGRKVSLPDLFDWRARSSSFQQMAAVRPWLFSLSSGGKVPEGVLGFHVTPDFFEMFRISALHGRLLQPKDHAVGGPRVAVVSAALWRRRFGADAGLVGRTVHLDAEPYTIVGVAPDDFGFGVTHMSQADAAQHPQAAARAPACQPARFATGSADRSRTAAGSP